jgi:3-hydroxyacyl-[acyl-carrier-protein] dehydratase
MRFLLVDRILHLEPGQSIEAEKSLPASEELFRDHFPGFPVVPGVLLTEMMAQAAGKCLNAERLPRGNAMLVEIRNARFRSWVRPDETIRLQATIESNQEKFAVAKCQAAVAGRKVCSAELLYSFMPIGEFSPDYRDDVLEEFLARRSAAGEGVLP